MTGPPAGEYARIIGEVFSHRLLWHTAQSLADRAAEKIEDSYHLNLAAVLFSYFAFEAFLNFIGDRIAPDKWKAEKEFFSRDPYRGTYGKLRFLAERTGYPLKTDGRPGKTLRELAEARFAVVHAHPEKIDAIIWAEAAADLPTSKEPMMFAYGERAFCERVLADVETVADDLLLATTLSCDTNEYLGSRAFKGMAWHEGGHIVKP